MRVGISLTLNAQIKDKVFQTTLGWNAVGATEVKKPDEDKDIEVDEVISIPIGFKGPNED